jgi:TonB family protein
MTKLATSVWMLSLAGFLLVGFLSGCGSSGPLVGRDVEKRIYLLEGEKVDQPPEIIGGYDAVEKLKSYPSAAEEDDAYGVIWLQCTVSATGKATRIQLARGGHPALETEALNVIQRLEFRPALKGGAPIQSEVQIPIIFQGPYAKKKTEGKEGE